MIDELTKVRIELEVAKLRTLAAWTAVEFHRRTAIAVNDDGSIIAFIDNQPIVLRDKAGGEE